jgi:LysM repeat protein
MKNLRQVLLGVIIALASIGLSFGGFSLSLTEGSIIASPTPTQTMAQTFFPTVKPFLPSTETPTPIPSLPLIITLTTSPTFAPTVNSTYASIVTPSGAASLLQATSNCPLPYGWLPYFVQIPDTLAKIATRHGTSVAALQQANCLLTTGLVPGVVIYVPPAPTPAPLPCGRPNGWIIYYVQPGDTLYRLSLGFGITVAELQQANCRGNATLLRVGQVLYVPPWVMSTPLPTLPIEVTSTFTPTIAPDIGLPTETLIDSPTDTPTQPSVPTASDIPTEVPTETLTPTCSC